MRDVVVIGGGLTGLSAAYELAQHKLDVTLIEVKRHLGGSIQTVKQEYCIMDSAAFAVRDTLDSEWLESLGLHDALFPLDKQAVAFKNGTASLIDALREKITATRLMRMAVSSIGELDNGDYCVCMENGLVFDDKSLILAVPARYA
jgi:protoporphyrinogen oxidase